MLQLIFPSCGIEFCVEHSVLLCLHPRLRKSFSEESAAAADGKCFHSVNFISYDRMFVLYPQISIKIQNKRKAVPSIT
jgi:hypothetical protein